MVEIIWSPQSLDDLDAIAEFIAQDSPQYAALFVIDVLSATEKLAQFPGIGRVVPEADNPLLREIILGNYRIIYRMFDDVVQIVTVYHGARLLDPGTL